MNGSERRADSKPEPASRLGQLAIRPSRPAQADMEPRPSFPAGDRPMHSSDEGLR
jgi:hypothetical protein